jgi:hypothetical protein
VHALTEDNHIPLIHFDKDDRKKVDVVPRHVAAPARTGPTGVAAIGVAQEYRT